MLTLDMGAADGGDGPDPALGVIYTKLRLDFIDDGCAAPSVSMTILLAGNAVAVPPTGLGYNTPALDTFLDVYINSAAGLTKYGLKGGTRITAADVAAANASATVSTLVSLIRKNQP